MPFSAFAAEGVPLFERHHQEVEAPHGRTLRPDFDAYRAYNAQGIIGVWAARAEDRLVGYIVFFAERHLHHGDEIRACVDFLWLAPEHRSFVNAKSMIESWMAALKERGVQYVRMNSRDSGKLALFSKLLTRYCGFEQVETIVERRL